MISRYWKIITSTEHILSFSRYDSMAVINDCEILLQENANIFKNLTPEQFAQVRSMTIEMVLGTDMSKHFDQLKIIQKMLSSNE
jgi:hypothetical protein